MTNNAIYSLLATIVLVSCNNSSIKEEMQHYNLVVEDSICCEYGHIEQIVIGSIKQVVNHPYGGTLVLDGALNKVIWILEDDSIVKIAESGTGPGFLENPSCIAIASNTIFIADRAKRAILRYDLSGNYLDSDISTGYLGPTSMQGLENGRIFAGVPNFEYAEDGDMVFTYQIGMYNHQFELIKMCYYNEWKPPLNEVYSLEQTFDAVSGNNGRMYFTPDNTEYVIHVSDVNSDYTGDMIGTHLNRVRKTSEELVADDQVMDRIHCGDYFYDPNMEPCKYKSIINLAGVDSLGNLWVQNLDVENRVLFDIWNSDGNMFAQADIAWEPGREPVRPYVDAEGILLITTPQADDVRIYKLCIDGMP